MYYIYWIKPDGSIGTAEVENGEDLSSWTKRRGIYLKCRLCMFIPDSQLWATYTNIYLRHPEKYWKIISPETIPSDIRAYRLLTH